MKHSLVTLFVLAAILAVAATITTPAQAGEPATDNAPVAEATEAEDKGSADFRPAYLSITRLELSQEGVGENLDGFTFLLNRAGVVRDEDEAKTLLEKGKSTNLPSPALGKFFWGNRGEESKIFQSWDVSVFESRYLPGWLVELEGLEGMEGVEDIFVHLQLGDNGGRFIFVGCRSDTLRKGQRRAVAEQIGKAFGGEEFQKAVAEAPAVKTLQGQASKADGDIAKLAESHTALGRQVRVWAAVTLLALLLAILAFLFAPRRRGGSTP